MEIGLQTWGSDGDIRPIIALAGGLAKAGHKVTLAAASVDGKNYSALAAALGFKIIHTGRSGGPSLEETARKIKSTNFPLKHIQILMEEQFAPFQDGMFEAAAELAHDCRVLAGHHIAGSLKAAAEKAGRGYASVFLCHSFIPTGSAAPSPMPGMGAFLNRAMWKIGGALVNRVMLRHFNVHRARLGLAPLNNILHSGWKSPTLNLVAVSPSLCQKPQDWDRTHHVCGFFDIPLAAEEWNPPPDLQKFLADGPPPVYFTFGSMTQMFTAEATRLMVEAARLAGVRAVVQSHWERAGALPESPEIFRISKAPHHKIFPFCAAVVHHGGAGTTHSACYSGTPSVVVAHAFDQEFWGGELKRNGIGGKVLDIRSATPEKLAREVRAVTGSKEIAGRARAVGRAMRAEDGVGAAVTLIEKTFG